MLLEREISFFFFAASALIFISSSLCLMSSANSCVACSSRLGLAGEGGSGAVSRFCERVAGYVGKRECVGRSGFLGRAGFEGLGSI